ncbi:5'-adenylylsulfate reductase 1, chloroplastic-like [Pyrus x bretschneideri]|uniref:5'-adenylylsulfate reductase 1, chloroplastic-like n=1 Tax=Pyrus x bretschneideri TaxID=225117 RepID=UPI000510A8E4|nr:5'-adenylylsulfate reductase 1, chloroplastic-like [Pyrus x bretschneideri]
MVALFDILNPISGSRVLVDEDLNGSLLMKWNQQIAIMGCQEILHQYYWKCLQVQAMEVAAVTLHFPQEFLSTAEFKPCNIIMPLLLFGHDEREGTWWPEEVNKATECGLKIGDVEVKQKSRLPQFNESFLKLESLSAPWLVFPFTRWYHICQALEESRVELEEGQMVSTHDRASSSQMLTPSSSKKVHADDDDLFFLLMMIDGHDQCHMDLLVWKH